MYFITTKLKPIMRILLVLLMLSYSKLSFSQEITTGIGLFINSTTFKSDLTNNTQSGFLTVNSRPWVGMNLSIVEKVDLQTNITWYNQIDESVTYTGYEYHYSFLTLQNNVVYAQNDRFNALFHHLLKAGIYLPPSAFESWFVSNAINDEDLLRLASGLENFEG